MNDETHKANDTLERATRQLDIIEQLIALLMDGIDFNELKMSDRLNIALKLMTQHARTLKLRDDISSDKDHSSKDLALLASLRRHLRSGPSSDLDFDDPSSSQMDFDPFFSEEGA
jgi:hypothetical protein